MAISQKEADKILDNVHVQVSNAPYSIIKEANLCLYRSAKKQYMTLDEYRNKLDENGIDEYVEELNKNNAINKWAAYRTAVLFLGQNKSSEVIEFCEYAHIHNLALDVFNLY